MAIENVANNAAQNAFVPKIGISAKKAMDVTLQRKDSFTMNEFGDVGVVDLGSLKKMGKLEKEDVSAILTGAAVKVRTPNAEPSRKPQTVKLGKFEAFCAKVADWLNLPTTGRANRMQNAMEYSFGCAVANIVNLSHLSLSGLDSAPAKNVSSEIERHLTEFFKKADSFVKAFRLDKVGRNAAEDCENQIVSRFVHSLENAGDAESLEKILSVALNWAKQNPPNRIDRIIGKLSELISARNDVKAAVPKAEKPVGKLTLVANALKDMFRTTSSKVREIEKICSGVGEEMDMFRQAFETISSRLKNDLETGKDISVDAFTDVVKEMYDKISEAIAKGCKLIEDRLAKEEAKRKEDVLAELDKGYGDIKNIDVEKTNKYVLDMLTDTAMTGDMAKSQAENRDIIWGYHPKGKQEDGAETKLAGAHTVNTVNKAIEAFAKARSELETIRFTVGRYEICELLIKKEEVPPEGVDTGDWQEACRSVSDFISSGFNLRQTESKHIDLICRHKEHFIAGLPPKAQARLERLFEHSAFVKGFSHQCELKGLVTDSASFENCQAATSVFCEKLLENIDEFGNTYAPEGENNLTDRAIKEKLTEIVKDGISGFRSKIQTAMPQTIEKRHEGVFFTNDAEEVCWISNADMKELVSKLGKAIGRADAIIAYESALAFASNHTVEKRTELLEKTQAYLKPLVEAYRGARGILAANALARIRQGLGYIRNIVPSAYTEASWNAKCDEAERAVLNIRDGNNVRETVAAFESIQADIEKDLQYGDGPKAKLADAFAQDLELLTDYGEQESSAGALSLGNVHLRRTVRSMDNLARAHKRAWDMENLVTNSLQSVSKFLKRLATDKYMNEFKSEWLDVKTDRFSIAADKLRTDFSNYTKCVMEYVRTLREEGATSEGRQKAANAVRESLGACCSSFAPIMGLLADIEVFVRERYDAYDNQAPGYEDRSAVCFDLDFAKLYAGMRTAIHNAFAALSEISRGAVYGLENYAAEDGLSIIDVRLEKSLSQYDYNAVVADVEIDMRNERAEIDFKGQEAFTKRAGENSEKTKTLYETRETYRREHEIDSSHLTAAMKIRRSLSDELFRSMEKLFLMLSAAKQNGTLPASVIGRIQELVAGRVTISSLEDLKAHLGGTMEDIAAVEKHEDLVGQLCSLSSKWNTFGVKKFGDGVNEASVVRFDEYLKTAKIKDYSVSAIDILQGAVSRVVIKDNSGNQAYYTVKYNPGKQGKGGEIEFTPEPNSLKRFFGKGFAAFTVKESYSVRSGENLEFPLKLTEREQIDA